MLDNLEKYNAGIVSINEDIAKEYSLSSLQILDACTNIKVASRVLYKMQSLCKKSGEIDSICALESYGKYVGIDENYMQGVLINYNDLNVRKVKNITNVQAENSSIFPDGSNTSSEFDSDWSNNGLFLDIPIESQRGGSKNNPDI